MSVIEKVINKVFSESSISYNDAERILFYLGFSLKITSSHHIFTKKDYADNISLKKRRELQFYQTKYLRKILKDHGYEKK